MSNTTSTSKAVSPAVVKTAADLDRFVRSILITAGASEPNAIRVAEALVASNLCGVDTHGVWHVPGYVERMRAGEIDGAATPKILSDSGNTALVSGSWTFGHVGAKYATEVAIEKALSHGLALVSLVEADHIGRLGEYVELAASRGLISMLWAGGFSEKAPAAAPYGGRVRMLHTNPVAMAFPSADGPCMMFDFATTLLSGVKVHNARDKGVPLPPGAIIDNEGNPTTDAAAFFDGGAALPFGGHKGYALMMASEFLGRILSGSDAFATGSRGGPIFGHSGATMLAFRADLFQPQTEYVRRSEEMATRIRSTPPAPGFKEVLMPGDPESRTRAARLRDGIPIPQELWQKLTGLANSLGVTGF